MPSWWPEAQTHLDYTALHIKRNSVVPIATHAGGVVRSRISFHLTARANTIIYSTSTPTHTIFLVENLLLMTVRLSDFEVYTPVRLGYIRCLHQFFLVQFCENVIITFLPRLVQ